MSGTDYDSFISYSHSGDRPVAKALQRTLHRLGRRWYRASALRVFRDDTTLAAAPGLWNAIERALRGSRTFVLLASPESAKSVWVDKEVALWREERSRDDFFLVLTAGELVWDDKAGDFDRERTTALPETAYGWFDAEPLWIDLRGHRERVRRIPFRNAAAAVAAAIHGVDKDELLNEEVRQQRRLVGVLSALLVLALVAGAGALWQRNVAIAQRDRADAQAKVALSRALAAESDVRATNDPQLAARLALASRAVAGTAEAGGAVLRRLDENRHVPAFVRRGSDQPIKTRHGSIKTTSRVAITDDGSLVAFASEGNPEVTLWDVREQREVGRLNTGQPDPASGGVWDTLLFDRAGSVLVAHIDFGFVVWNVRERRVVRFIQATTGDYGFALSPDGKWLAQADERPWDGNSIRLWRVDTGEEVPAPERSAGPLPSSVLFDRDSKRAYMAFPDGVHALDLATATWSDRPVAASGTGRLHAVALDAHQFFVAADDVVQRWDETTGARLGDVPSPGLASGGLDASADGRTVVATLGKRLVAVDTATGRSTDLVTHRSEVIDVALSGTGAIAVSVSVNGDVVVTAPTADPRSPASASYPEPVSQIAVAADAPVAAFGRDGGIDLVDLPSLKTRRHLPIVPPLGDPAMALSPDGKRLAVLEFDAVHVVDAETGATVVRWPLGSGGAGGIAFAGDATKLLVESARGAVLRDVQSGAVVQTIAASENDGGVVTSSNGRFLVAAYRDPARQQGFEVWRWDGDRYADPVRVAETIFVQDVAITDDGTTLGLADVDGRVVLITVARPEDRRYLQATAIGGAIVFTSDSHTVVRAECTLDGVLSWDAADGVQGATWSRGPAPDLTTCQRTPRRPLLKATSANGALVRNAEGGITLWRMDIGAAANVLCSAAGALDGPEKDRYLRDFAGVVPDPCG